MKNIFKPALFVLLMCGVFGADEDKVKAVMEGDSVTLNPDLTQIQGFLEIEWRFKDSDQPIAYTDGSKPTYPENERFRDRLKLDHQTGSLTITNMKTKHSGLYKLLIELNSGPLPVNFAVTVYESPSVIDAVKGERKFESVKEGDPVTLQTDVTQLSGDELIVWRFGDEGKLIAKADMEAKSSALYDTDEGFRGRLELDQTGSLIITNTRTTVSGFYAVKISSNKQTVYKRFTVTVSEPGLCLGDKAWIGGVVVVLLVLLAAGVIYYCRKIREQTLSVKEGEDVTLKPNNKINKDDLIQWMFGDKKQQICLAEISGKPRKRITHGYVADGIFRGRLKLDQTGSLTITDTRTTHSGLYQLRIISCCRVSVQTFFVIVKEKEEVTSVEEDGFVTLNPDPEIQRDDLILWMFGYQYDLIAQIRGGTVEIYDEGAGEIFRDRLKLNETGSLTISNITTRHIGLYKLLTISSSRGILCKKFWVFIQRRHEVTAGDPVHLSTDHPKIERDDAIEWMFGDENILIAEIKGGTRETYDGPDGRFRNRLELDKRTGELTILNFTAEHAGLYNLKIRSSKGDTNWTYIVTIRDEVRGKPQMKGSNVSSGKRVNESAVEMRSLLDK